MAVALRWLGVFFLSLLLIVVPWVYFRWEYTYAKRFRIVTPGVLYRSGEMTGAGFTKAVQLYHLRCIVNLQDEYPDPELYRYYFTTGRIKESELCRQLGVRYVYIPPDLLPRRELATQQPRAIDQFLNVMDDKSNWPVLIHCRAGLHRTGIMTSLYRMEYEGWTPNEAIHELKANGFGEWPCTASNEYIDQYILRYHARNEGRGVREEERGANRRVGSISGPSSLVPRPSSLVPLTTEN
jgi:tyrosine-protein phosphatase SIW14